ncbi:MAG: hypothetical protein ACRCZF_16200, partial [Gemmataceae bacterium]
AQVAAYRMNVQGWSSQEAIQEMLRIQPRRSGFERDMLEYLELYPQKKRSPQAHPARGDR